MNNERINAIIRELRQSAENLPNGKRRDINNKLDRITLALRKYEEQDEAEVSPEELTRIYERQKMQVYNYLLAGNTITSLQAIKKFGITRLSAVIFNIGKMTGKAPNRRFITVPNRYGKNTRVCEYWIEQEGAE